MFRKTQYFRAIVEAGGLTKAAERLFVSQPYLSQYLKRLEKDLGVDLFDHSTSPLQLTYAGEQYYAHIVRQQKADIEIRKELLNIKNEMSGRLRVGVPLWRGACLLPDTFLKFHEKYPNIKLELIEKAAEGLENTLLSNNVDIVIMNLPRTLNYDKVSLEVLMEERILIAAPTKHPYVQHLLANYTGTDKYPPTSLDIIKYIPIIITKPEQALTKEVNYLLGKYQIIPDILMETGNLTTAINLTAEGLCCTFVPEEGAKVCQHPNKVTYLAIEPAEIWDLAAFYTKESLSHLGRAFIDSLKEQLNN